MRTLLLRLAALVALLGGPDARADAPCVNDAARLCPGIPAQDGQLWACLVQHQTELSSQCVRNVQEVQRRARELAADCAADVYRFCPAVPRGQGRVVRCLGAHVGRRELSSTCEEAVATALENVKEFSAACGNEAASL